MLQYNNTTFADGKRNFFKEESISQNNNSAKFNSGSCLSASINVYHFSGDDTTSVHSVFHLDVEFIYRWNADSTHMPFYNFPNKNTHGKSEMNIKAITAKLKENPRITKVELVKEECTYEYEQLFGMHPPIISFEYLGSEWVLDSTSINCLTRSIVIENIGRSLLENVNINPVDIYIFAVKLIRKKRTERGRS